MYGHNDKVKIKIQEDLEDSEQWWAENQCSAKQCHG